MRSENSNRGGRGETYGWKEEEIVMAHSLQEARVGVVLNGRDWRDWGNRVELFIINKENGSFPKNDADLLQIREVHGPRNA